MTFVIFSDSGLFIAFIYDRFFFHLLFCVTQFPDTGEKQKLTLKRDCLRGTITTLSNTNSTFFRPCFCYFYKKANHWDNSLLRILYLLLLGLYGAEKLAPTALDYDRPKGSLIDSRKAAYYFNGSSLYYIPRHRARAIVNHLISVHISCYPRAHYRT